MVGQRAASTSFWHISNCAGQEVQAAQSQKLLVLPSSPPATWTAEPAAPFATIKLETCHHSEENQHYKNGNRHDIQPSAPIKLAFWMCQTRGITWPCQPNGALLVVPRRGGEDRGVMPHLCNSSSVHRLQCSLWISIRRRGPPWRHLPSHSNFSWVPTSTRCRTHKPSLHHVATCSYCNNTNCVAKCCKNAIYGTPWHRVSTVFNTTRSRPNLTIKQQSAVNAGHLNLGIFQTGRVYEENIWM